MITVKGKNVGPKMSERKWKLACKIVEEHPELKIKEGYTQVDEIYWFYNSFSIKGLQNLHREKEWLTSLFLKTEEA